MKKVLVSILLIGILIGAGYFVLPILIQKETKGFRTELQDVKQRLQKIEEFTQIAPLKPDADFQKVINSVNALYAKVVSLEDSLKKKTSAINDMIDKQNTSTKEAFKKQAEAFEKLSQETQVKIQEIMFDATMANIRGHILKAKVEISAKNIGVAKTELDLINELFSKVATVVSDKNKNAIKELQASLQKARSEIDTDLPSASNKIDLLWYEMSRLLRKA